MAIELSYVLITPYSLMKSRTGGILARLLSRTDLDMVGAQMIAFDKELAEKYADSLYRKICERDKKAADLLSNYVREYFPPFEEKKERVLMLLFRGEDACRKLFEISGTFSHKKTRDSLTGETIRDTYADLVISRTTGRVRYFEPAILTPPDQKIAKERLRMFADYASTTPNIIEGIVGKEDESQRTLVIIKPDNWRHPSTRPGNIIDILSRTGLRIVGCKVYKMSNVEALEFYGPVQNALRKKLAPIIGERAKETLEVEFNIKLKDQDVEKLTETAGISYADDQFEQIVEFMSGRRPSDCPEDQKNEPGLVKCLILIYEGKNAIEKIRNVLGPTDPTKAPGGTVRRDFGKDVMVNTAHASDSPESVKRETKIVKIENNELSKRIYEFLDHNHLYM